MTEVPTFCRHELLKYSLLVAMKLISWKRFNKINSMTIFCLNIATNYKVNIFVKLCGTNITKSLSAFLI